MQHAREGRRGGWKAASALILAAWTLMVTQVSRADEPTYAAVSPVGSPVGSPVVSPEGPPMGWEIPDELAVDLRDDVSESAVAELGNALGALFRPASTQSAVGDRLMVLDAPLGRRAQLMEQLRSDPRVEFVEPMSVYVATFIPNDPLFREKQWHLSRVGAERAWDYACGAGITVAVVDTGIACFDAGPFTRGSDLRKGRCVEGFDFISDKPGGADDNGHGTHVAGTVGQATHNGVGASGLAHCASLLPVKVLNRWGWGTVTSVAQGIRYAADRGAQIINLSLGGRMRSAILESAVQYARKRGVLVVAAAGNSGGAVDYPGAYPGVLAVGATGRTDTLAQFSSRGPEVGLSAPGVEVTQQTICQGGLNRCELFGTFSGTSMASPHVAGAAALVMSMGVTHPDDVRTVLVRSSRSMGSAATIPDPLLRQGASAPTRHGAHGGGAGILQAGAAVAGAHWSRVGFRLSALVLFVLALHRWIRRKRGTFAWSPVSVGSAVWGAVGLLPALPWVAPVGGAASLRPWLEGLLRPVAEWDLLLGVRAHGYLALASVIPPLAVAAVALGRPAGRAIAGGLALGTAAYLAPIVVHADVLGPFGPGVLGAAVVRIWAAANVVACLWLARVTLDRTL